ncbi:MAG: hypothetical protein JSS66_04135 [Armatimonadetes bacterium]|nr:hypothetical protein [Armatimonadota bacterium]
MNWNPSVRQVEASFGGVLTRAEADCFLDDLRALLAADEVDSFEFVVDYAKVSRMDDTVPQVLDFAREIAQFSGASATVFVTRNEDEVNGWTGARLQQVLEGTERYVAYSIAA